MTRKTLFNLLPYAVFGLIFFTGLRPIVLGAAQRALLATGLWGAKAPPAPAAAAPTTPAVAAAWQPAELGLATLEGRPLEARRLRGKAVFVNLWATWCPPCRAEMPGIEALYERVDTSKVAFLMISLDEKPAKARDFIRRQGFRFPVYVPTRALPAVFATESIPTTIILAPDGQVAARYEGMADYNTPAFRAALEKLAGD
ncbi:TlpA family protein disulfide reductase [Hymenobacter sp. NST-14]|uniref:TlpA family protein disulfide reductase n=1 Tax=Hymenobacter piscis TaxID=2839984 RepID=UPI001C01ABD9|nr:TlpA disulfide reductase family protein [Hymenobacter piscis]MBT9394151.1 TlpA family protein disulfide reductase [Hymenobacter piscis]